MRSSYICSFGAKVYIHRAQTQTRICAGNTCVDRIKMRACFRHLCCCYCHQQQIPDSPSQISRLEQPDSSPSASTQNCWRMNRVHPYAPALNSSMPTHIPSFIDLQNGTTAAGDNEAEFSSSEMFATREPANPSISSSIQMTQSHSESMVDNVPPALPPRPQLHHLRVTTPESGASIVSPQCILPR